ncbi:MAPEG family protein [Niveibacterium umoris]|uniref:Glutathione S-transferase n=1 Tax=Niveibacterium umoris TaxID=1193620 RepID=A0A840BMX2_9RHOO|nr:MAPEG family protein [Niveibacterium umoris]MBB4013894.1 glutathione S-transferase [Niveibacterium umoris]
MHNYPLTAGVTLLLVLLMFGTAWNVGRAREKYGIKAPATTGNEYFERAYRIQLNTIEWALIFLPTLWIFAAFVGDRHAMIAGLVGLAGRILYAVSYQRDPATRGTGFMIGMAAFGVAGLWSGFAVVKALLGS